MTLRFIGNSAEQKLPVLIENVEHSLQTLLEPFDLIISQIGRFPSAQSNVIAAIAPLTKPIAGLYNALELATSAMGVPSENRPLRPHISLCRVHKDQRISINTIDIEPYSISIREMILYHSKPTENGSVYIPL